MNIPEIYQKFDAIGCLTFTTVNTLNEPISRIAHLRGYDEDGLYFMTMHTKSFYKHLKENGLIALCGLNNNAQIQHDELGLPVFQGGYAMRLTGKAKEVSIDEIKAKQNPIFNLCIKDHEKYPAMVVFCITSGYGDVFDYDFEKTNRDYKLERVYFAYNGAVMHYSGLQINQDSCIRCGICKKKCSFSAISVIDKQFVIDKYRCDECGDCYLNCPVQAIALKG